MAMVSIKNYCRTTEIQNLNWHDNHSLHMS